MAERRIESAPNGDKGYWSVVKWMDPEGNLKSRTVWNVTKPKQPKLVKDETGLIDWLKAHKEEIKTLASETAEKYDD